MKQPDRLEDFLNDCRHQAAIEAQSEFDHCFSLLAAQCQSPIERLLLAALVADRDRGIGIDIDFFSTRLPPPPFECMMVTAQSEIAGYKADFLIDVCLRNGNKVIVVECDGHDFHEKTKAQALHDKRRDRIMTHTGARILRFTGSEIWADPARCAEEIYSLAETMVDQCIRDIG